MTDIPSVIENPDVPAKLPDFVSEPTQQNRSSRPKEKEPEPKPSKVRMTLLKFPVELISCLDSLRSRERRTTISPKFAKSMLKNKLPASEWTESV